MILLRPRYFQLVSQDNRRKQLIWEGWLFVRPPAYSMICRIVSAMKLPRDYHSSGYFFPFRENPT